MVSSNIKSGVTIFGVSGTESVVETSDATATAANILEETTAYVDGELVEGSMVNNGAVTHSLGINGSYTIPAGYHSGAGKVTQSITTKAAATYTPGTTNQTISSGLYLSGAQTIKGDSNLVSGNIKAGVSIFGVEGNANVVDTSAGTATAAQILYNAVAYVDGVKLTGTMANNGAVSGSVNCGGSYTIPAGYHNGSGKVTGNSLASQTSATATAANILKDKTAWVGGTKLTGTMTNNGSVSATLAANGSYTIPAGYHDGTGKVTQSLTTKAATTITPGTTDQSVAAGTYLSGALTVSGDADLTTANVKYNVDIFGVTGTYTSDGTLAANKMLSGVIGYSKGTKYTGSIASQAAKSITPGTSNQTVSSGVYLSGNITVLGSSNLVASNIKSGVNIFGVTGSYNPASTIKQVVLLDNMPTSTTFYKGTISNPYYSTMIGLQILWRVSYSGYRIYSWYSDLPFIGIRAAVANQNGTHMLPDDDYYYRFPYDIERYEGLQYTSNGSSTYEEIAVPYFDLDTSRKLDDSLTFALIMHSSSSIEAGVGIGTHSSSQATLSGINTNTMTLTADNASYIIYMMKMVVWYL